MRTNVEYLVKIRRELECNEHIISVEIENLREEIKIAYDNEERRDLYRKNGDLYHRRQAIRGQLHLISHLLNYDTPLDTTGRIRVCEGWKHT